MEIKRKLTEFIGNTLKMELSNEKTLITHSNQYARFLGYDVRVRRDGTVRRRKDHVLQRVFNNTVKLNVPLNDKVCQFLFSKGVVRQGKDGTLYPVRRYTLESLTDLEILTVYIAELRGICNYYSMASNFSKLDYFAYMAVTGYAGTYIAVLIGGNTFKWRFVERDEELTSMLIELESAFWNHVQDGTPPPLDGSDASAKFLAQRFPNSNPKSSIALPAAAADLLAQYDDACAQLEAVTERKQQAENLLKEMMGENEIGTAGDRIITWKSVSQERLDSRTLKAEHPILCQKYTNKISYRRFTVKAAS